MYLKECSFRDLLSKVCSIEGGKELNRKLLCHNTDESLANRVLFYPFVDHGAGMIFFLLGYAKKDKKNNTYTLVPPISLDDIDSDEQLFFTRQSLEDLDEYDVDLLDIDEDIMSVFKERISFMENRKEDADEQVLAVRENTDLDHLRDRYNPDVLIIVLDHSNRDVSVEGSGMTYTINNMDNTEKAIIRSICMENDVVYGTLLTEPVTDCRLHMRDEIPAVLCVSDKGVSNESKTDESKSDENKTNENKSKKILVCPVSRLVEDEEPIEDEELTEDKDLTEDEEVTE